MDTEIICHECGMILRDANEYHPGEYCVLVAAGFDPCKFVLEAVHHVTPEAVATELGAYRLGVGGSNHGG